MSFKYFTVCVSGSCVVYICGGVKVEEANATQIGGSSCPLPKWLTENGGPSLHDYCQKWFPNNEKVSVDGVVVDGFLWITLWRLPRSTFKIRGSMWVPEALQQLTTVVTWRNSCQWLIWQTSSSVHKLLEVAMSMMCWSLTRWV